MGSFSRIERTTPTDKATYELYGSGDLHLGRLLHNRRFDFAMVAFLDCLKQLIDYVRSQDPHVDFPHQYAGSPECEYDMCSLPFAFTQDRQGQNRRSFGEAAVQPGGGVDARTATCAARAQDPAQVDDKRQQRLSGWPS